MTGTAPRQEKASAVTLPLVHTEAESLADAVPGVAPSHPPVTHTHEWEPSGPPVHHDEPDHQSALDYAEYVGRVGVLAAALGVGATLSGVPGIATAEPANTDTSTSSSTSESTPADTGTSTDSTTASPSDESPTNVVSSSGRAQTSTNTSSTSTSSTDSSNASPSETSTTVTAPGSTSPPATVSSSGGARTSTETNGAADLTPADATTPTAPLTAPAPTPPSTSSDTTPPVATAPAAAPITPPAATDADPGVPGHNGHSSPTAQSPAAAPAATTTAAAATIAAPAEATPILRVTPTQEATPTTTSTTTSLSDAIPAATPAAEALPTTPFPVVNQVIDAVVSPLTAPASTPAAQAAQTPILFGVLAWVRRTFFNQTPTLAYHPAATEQVDNTVTGKITATDVDHDGLTLTASTPTHGTVTIAPDGTFTYTVTDPDYLANGGQDSFTITATDADPDFHIHGLPGLLNLISFGLIGNPGHTATTTMNVTIITNGPPVVTQSPPSQPNPTTGTVTGSLVVVDPDGDPFVVSLADGRAPAYGTVTLDNTAGTYTYTYIPNQAGHIIAGLDPGFEDSFTVNITQPATTQPIKITVTNTDTLSAAINALPAPTTQTLTAAAAPAALTEDGYSQQVTINGIQIDPQHFDVSKKIFVTNPYGVATVELPNHETRAYVVGANIVSVIDTATNNVVATIPVGAQPTRVAFSPDGTRAYVTNEGSNTVSVINTTTNTVVDGPIDVRGSGPIAVAVVPDVPTAGSVAGRVYVTNLNNNTVSMIDYNTVTDEYTVNTPISLGDATTSPQGVAVSPDGTRLYVTGLGSVSMIDTTTNEVTEIPVGVGSFGIGFSSDGQRLYVTSATNLDGTGTYVSVINTDPTPGNPDFNKEITQIPVDAGPIGLAVSPDGSLIYVTHYFDHTMTVIAHNTADDTYDVIPDRIEVGNSPIAVAVEPHDGNLIYVTNDNPYQSDNSVTVISIDPTAP